MKIGIIITLPRHDDVTEYLSQFSHQIEDEAISKRVAIKSLRDKEATQIEFEKVVKKLDYKMLIFNGHGSIDSISGQKETIVKLGTNDSLLRERIVYARSCNAAVELGKRCTEKVKEGCFIGYDRPFQFYVDVQWIGNPLRDNTARIFLEPSNLVSISIIKGNSALEANNNSKNQILKNIKRVLRNPNTESFKLSEALWNNYEGQVLLGNQNSRL